MHENNDGQQVLGEGIPRGSIKYIMYVECKIEEGSQRLQAQFFKDVEIQNCQYDMNLVTRWEDSAFLRQ